MGEHKDLSQPVRAALKARGNPYGFADATTSEDPPPAQAIHDQYRAAYRQSENPHAFHYYAANKATLADPVQPAHATPLDDRPQGKLSKADFRTQCRDLFRPYIPAIEKGRLRPHHRAFIDRNAARSPETRYALMAHLQKYSLADVPGLSSQFNREREDLTEIKLLAIERAVGIPA